MTRGTKKMTRQQIKDALDKNFARIGGGMGGRMMRGSAAARRGQHDVHGRDQAGQPPRRAGDPPPDPPRADPARGRVRGHQEREDRRHRAGPHRPMRLGLNRFQRLLAHYPSDDVRYVPTLDEQLERLRKLTLDQVRTLYREYLGADHGELVVIGDFEPSEILPILARTLEGWKAEKPYARIERPYPARHQGGAEDDRDARQGQRGLLGGPPDPAQGQRSRLSGARGRQLHPGRRRPLLADRRSTPSEGGALLHGDVDVLRRSLRSPGRLDDPGDLQPDQRREGVTGVNEEVARLLRDGVTAEELERARTGYLQQLRSSAATTRRSRVLAENLYIGRTMRFQAEFEQKIQELTPEAVNAAIRKYIDPKRLSSSRRAISRRSRR